MSAAPPFDGFEQREEQALGRSLVLAVAVHVVLVAILFVGIRWESHPPAAMVVELWPALPTSTPSPAPKVQPPPPPKPAPKPKPIPKVQPVPPPPVGIPPQNIRCHWLTVRRVTPAVTSSPKCRRRSR